MTLEGIAKALNRKLVVNKKALKMVREKYEAFAVEKDAEFETDAAPGKDGDVAPKYRTNF
jgi:molybdopterin-biosynthesis enzyme MoeA-like protein